MRIDHVQLAMPAGGENAARAFFGDLLGMKEIPKPEALRVCGGCWFRLGSCEIHVGVDADFRPQRKAHPAFAVNDVDATAARIEAAGHEVGWDDTIPGVRRFYTDDPFGNRVELVQEHA